MAQYGKRQGRDTLENLLVRVGELEDKLKRLSGSPSRSSFDRGDTASVPDPLEGQTMVQYDTESPYYYSNGQWRPFSSASAGSDIPWAVLNSGASEAVGANTGMDFTFATSQFNTNDPTMFSLRTGSPSFQGIAILQTGVYECVWAAEATRNSVSPSPDTIGIEIAPNSSFTNTYVNQVDYGHADTYGKVWTPGTSVSLWRVRALGLVGIDDVTSERYVALGAFNRSSTAFTTTGGYGLTGHIYIKRLSVPLADFSNFF